MLKIIRCVLFIFLCSFFVSFAPCQADPVLGMYGVSSSHIENIGSHRADAHLTSVFVPPDQQTIARFKEAGLQVYLTMNVFGGTESWKKYPDSVPITASGKAVSSHIGGICPTHYAWREERLALLADWLQKFGITDGIDGVWLDFIRYPGRWEEKQPEVEDTCYCPRCLQLFQVEKGVKIPEHLPDQEAAAWIHAHAEPQWRQWKKEQITSFVRDARSVVDKRQGSRPVQLGAFLVPWMQGERQGAVLTQLAQDATQIAGYADVVSPMVYHKMVGRPAEWVGEISTYFAEMTDKAVWPIIQAADVTAEEFAGVVQSVSHSSAEGLLVFTLSAMQDNLWPLLGKFNGRKNLLANPQFISSSPQTDPLLPSYWQHGKASVIDSHYLFQSGDTNNGGRIGIRSGLDRLGAWQVSLPPCDSQKRYHFSADFFREERTAGAYPEVELWGQQYLLNTHRVIGKFQKIQVEVQCPQGIQDSELVFSFLNTFPGTTFWLRNPQLVEETPCLSQQERAGNSVFFPLGAYGATVDNLAQMKTMGLNSAVMPMNEKAVDACIHNEIHCLLSVPHDIDSLLLAINKLGDRLRSGGFSFYVNDEPEIHSFPSWKAMDIQRILHDQFPGIPTSMAVVRPQGIPEYAGAADLFMLDQYPVPSMPMSWLSDSLDEAARFVGRNRLQSVIQAFGGSQWAKDGWPRLPTFAEMDCLAFLSLIHGSRGLYFFTFPIITGDDQGKKDLQRVLARLQKMLPWLKTENRTEPVPIEMLSANRRDPAGKPAVHCALKEKDSEQMLMCVNVLSTYTKALVSVPDGGHTVWQDFFGEGRALVVNEALQFDFLPFEVKVFVRPVP